MTREIALDKGYVALVDDEDFERVSSLRWSVRLHPERPHNIYAIHRRGRRTIWMHRFVMDAGPDDPRVDHRNGNGLDNRRRANLRFATHSQNARNKRPQLGRAFKGVCRHKYGNARPWQASICVNNKVSFIGRFATEIEAARAYDLAASRLHADFARLNFDPNRDWLFPFEHMGNWPPPA